MPTTAAPEPNTQNPEGRLHWPIMKPLRQNRRRNQTAPPENERGADQSWLQYGSVHGCRGPGLCHKLIHHHIVAQTAAHDKQVKDLMGTEIAVSGIKDRQFQGVDDASNCVNDTACK